METKKMKLSLQAMSSLMMALQVCLIQEIDIVELLKDLELELNDDGELIVLNPPAVEFPKEMLDKLEK